MQRPQNWERSTSTTFTDLDQLRQVLSGGNAHCRIRRDRLGGGRQSRRSSNGKIELLAFTLLYVPRQKKFRRVERRVSNDLGVNDLVGIQKPEVPAPVYFPLIDELIQKKVVPPYLGEDRW
jgi:hypothetical protein